MYEEYKDNVKHKFDVKPDNDMNESEGSTAEDDVEMYSAEYKLLLGPKNDWNEPFRRKRSLHLEKISEESENSKTKISGDGEEKTNDSGDYMSFFREGLFMGRPKASNWNEPF